MNRVHSNLVMLGVALTFGACSTTTSTEELEEARLAAEQLTGNGGPAGAHYNLNIIGVPKAKRDSLTGGDGRRIFVPLEGSAKIMLSQGDFQVLDANGTDGQAAFQLPNPDPDNDGITQYSVFARALGKPGGSSKTTTCATDPTTGDLYCSVESMVMVRDKGKSSFSNVSKQLLYVYADVDGDGVVDRMPLFDSRLEDYFWQYDNSGLKLLQLRFYEQPTNVN
ncbi:MAG TPA: hypothetical protein VJV78_36450 [Polyangiales bacterium]|nr:hypothetical protein [Polyangiales bacterium]